MAADTGYKGVDLLDGTAQGDTLSLAIAATNAWVSAGGTADKAEINSAISKLESARSALGTEAQKLSANLNTITLRQDFTKGITPWRMALRN